MAGDRGGGGDGGGHEVGAAATALATFEVAVARAGRPLARAPACRGSSPGTCCSRARASRRRRRGRRRRAPRASAWAFTAWLPGTTMTRLRGDRAPASTAAAARRSSMRPFVQLPMNTVSTAMSRIRRARLEPHVLEGPRRRSRALVGSSKSSGDGTLPSIVATCAGLVPHVTCGRSVAASMHDLLVEHRAVVGDERAPVGDGRVPVESPCGAWARPCRYSNVVSSGAIRPAFAPASIDMLQTVIRPSIDSARIAEPRYSIT